MSASLGLSLDLISKNAGSKGFIDKLLDYGATEIWKLTDIYSGTTIPAYIDSTRNGVFSGWSLQDGDELIKKDGKAPKQTANTQGGNLKSTAIDSVFNGTKFSVFFIIKIADGSYWSDGAEHRIFYINDDANNFVYLRKSTANSLHLGVRVGGVYPSLTSPGPQTTTDWFTFGMSISDASNGGKGYWGINGTEQTSSFNITTNWTGNGTLDFFSLLNTSIGYTYGWLGWAAYFSIAIGTQWTPDVFNDLHSMLF